MPTVEQFIDQPRVQACLEKLKAAFSNRPLIVSDILDDHGHQYVHLVQKGGGVLGIALVGYTFILEHMGIRFLRLAGTSAGAINTGLLAVVGKKEEEKSKRVLKEICELDFFKLVDGHPAARQVIKRFITQKDFSTRMEKQLRWFGIVLGIFLLADGILAGLRHHAAWLFIAGMISFIITGMLLLVIGVIYTYLQILLKRLKDSGFGVNPGDYFYDWIKAQLAANGVTNIDQLNAKAAAVPKLNLRSGVDHPKKLDDLDGDVTFIASELVTQNKIELPKRWPMFRTPEAINDLEPAGFIRASMAIPIFFESYYIDNIPCTDPRIIAAWYDFNEKDPPTTVRFVDGGLLSNFPIDIFYKDDVSRPRLPVFGIDLDDREDANKSKHAMGWTLPGYLGRLLSTVRSNYDKAFLLKNRMYRKGIGTVRIPPKDFNWLDFFMKDKDMLALFALGAEAATQFLIDFRWSEYQDDRETLSKQISV